MVDGIEWAKFNKIVEITMTKKRQANSSSHTLPQGIIFGSRASLGFLRNMAYSAYVDASLKRAQVTKGAESFLCEHVFFAQQRQKDSRALLASAAIKMLSVLKR